MRDARVHQIVVYILGSNGYMVQTVTMVHNISKDINASVQIPPITSLDTADQSSVPFEISIATDWRSITFSWGFN